MGRMVRKQVYLEPEQDRLLKRRSKELGVTESDLIRQSIEQLARVSVALPLDRKAWRDELKFVMKRTRIKGLGRRRRWAREELYEERLGRLSR